MNSVYRSAKTSRDHEQLKRMAEADTPQSKRTCIHTECK